MPFFKTCAITALFLTGFVLPGWAKDSGIQKETQAFLEAYLHGDCQVILTLIDQENIMMYGSDATEIAMDRTLCSNSLPLISNCGEGRPTSEQWSM